MKRVYHKWWSNNLNREMEMLVFGQSGAKVLVFPTRGGRFYEYENMRMTEMLRSKIDNGHIQLYCVDSVDAESLYCFWAHPSGRIRRHQQYENYIIREVVPFMQENNPHECTISHGCSLGAFHAANIAFRHPRLFRKLAAFSGRYDLTEGVEWFGDLFDGYYDRNIYHHTPMHFLPELSCPKRLEHLRNMDIVMVVGEEDPFRENTIQMSRVLKAKGIDHKLYFWHERAHSGYYWRRMAPLYI